MESMTAKAKASVKPPPVHAKAKMIVKVMVGPA
jgi:hypothetical protein